MSGVLSLEIPDWAKSPLQSPPARKNDGGAATRRFTVFMPTLAGLHGRNQ